VVGVGELMLGACAGQNYSFYDLIVTKARGKSGPLFHFDVHDDVRMVNDSRVEKDEVGGATDADVCPPIF
jgi:hypothetical protein